MVEITLTDGLCRITFDSSTVEGLEITYAGPAAIYLKSNQNAFAYIGLEYLGIKEIFSGSSLTNRGMRHFLRLVKDLDASNWVYKEIDAADQFNIGPGWIKGDLEWHFALMTNDSTEAICAFCRINDDHVCNVASIFREGDNTKITKITNLIKSIRAHKI